MLVESYRRGPGAREIPATGHDSSPVDPLRPSSAEWPEHDQSFTRKVAELATEMTEPLRLDAADSNFLEDAPVGGR